MLNTYRSAKRLLQLLGLWYMLLSCYHEQEVAVVADFNYNIPEGSYTVPVEISLTNNTTGADFYRWTMEGASPASSDKKNPGIITYPQAGTYTIKLEAWNDTQRTSKEISIQLDSAVTLGFDAITLVNDFVPATVEIRNKTTGASTYEWTFQDGTPDKSVAPNPPPIHFDTPGDHTINLKVTNGRETFTTSRIVTLKPEMSAEFEITPSFDDFDDEAPLMATLRNKTTNGLHYLWSSTGGSIDNATGETTTIYFPEAGDFTVTLRADNDKETQIVEHAIHVKPNTNLYTMEDVRLGVRAAQATIGSFYVTRLRKVFLRDDVTEENGDLVDLVFFGINAGFSYCRFLSPDSAATYSFPAIPQASHTYLINTLETTAISFTVSDFDNMTNDSPLQALDIKDNDTGMSFFDNVAAPRIILFETRDGRKGAVKIKSFVSNGSESYVLVDIKMQKT